jgi:hypothetical protein
MRVVLLADGGECGFECARKPIHPFRVELIASVEEELHGHLPGA